jgi:hypothetical protein
MVTPIEQLTHNIEQEQPPICTRPSCLCCLVILNGANECLYHPTREFEKCN